MFTYKFIVKETKGNSLRLRLTNNRRVSEISMGFQLNPDDLADAMTAKPKSKNIRWKSVISDYQAKLDDIKCELLKSGRADEDVKVIRDIVLKECFNREETESKKEENGRFVTHFQSFINGKSNKGTKGVYKHTLDRIRLFDPDIEEKSFEDIDLKWLTNFEAFCAKTAGKNARNIHLRNIRAVFNNAIDYDLTAAYPFRRFKIRPETTRKRAMPVEDLRELFEYAVEPYAEIYRDMFKLIFMLIGINTVDLHGLGAITKEGRIEYKRAKTGRLYSIKVEPEAMEIIERYRGENGLLCIADRWADSRNFRHQCNKALQCIGSMKNKGGRMAGGAPKKTTSKPQGRWPGLTTYWARHSWATIAYSIGISKDVIAQALGHADGHDTTNIYINEDLSKVDDANRKVLDWVLYNKR